MSTLRRRLLDSSAEPSRDPSPVKGEPVTLVPASHLEKLKKKRSRRRPWLIFVLGGLFGIVVAAFFAQRNDVINLESLMDMNLESLIDVIPAGIIKDAKDITVCLYRLEAFEEAEAEADVAPEDSGMSAKPSITILSPLAYIYSRKG